MDYKLVPWHKGFFALIPRYQAGPPSPDHHASNSIDTIKEPPETVQFRGIMSGSVASKVRIVKFELNRKIGAKTDRFRRTFSKSWVNFHKMGHFLAKLSTDFNSAKRE